VQRARTFLAVLGLTVLLGTVQLGSAGAETGEVKRYNVVLAGTLGEEGFVLAGSREAVLALVESAGGAVANDMTRQIGVLVAESAEPLFAETLRASVLVEGVGEDFKVKVFPSRDEVLASGATMIQGEGGGPEQTEDPFEPLQWDMQQIHAPESHNVQAGWRAVDVGILDTGIDARHLDFLDPLGGGTNVDCSRGRNSIAFVPTGPGVGTSDPCTDNQFHGTHVAGTVAAQANNYGIVGVAPNVTLVPVKVCDAAGFCYASAAVDAITYAGDQKFDVINMSFFVDDNETLQSTEFKCMDDPVQRQFRQAVERAIQYARNQGVTPVAALGNSDEDLAHPSEPNENNCDVVPAETQGVVGTGALGRNSQKAGYSNYGCDRRGRARWCGRERRVRPYRPLDVPRQHVRVHPGDVDGLAPRGRSRGPDRQRVRHARLRRRCEAVADEGRGLHAVDDDRHRPARVRRVLRERPRRRLPRRSARHLASLRRHGALLSGVRGMRL
jgi:hypothetical protein